MNRYFVGHRISSPEANEYYQNITAELAEKFEVKNLGKRVAPHFTLKPPFESEKMGELEKILEEISKKQKIIDFEIEGFGKFENDQGKTVFLEVRENNELQNAVQSIADIIRDFGENHRELPPKIKLHASLARYMKNEQFNNVWEYLHSKPIPKFNLKLDNLTIFRYVPGGWEIFRQFPFSTL